MSWTAPDAQSLVLLCLCDRAALTAAVVLIPLCDQHYRPARLTHRFDIVEIGHDGWRFKSRAADDRPSTVRLPRAGTWDALPFCDATGAIAAASTVRVRGAADVP